jgi:hypothetical protein
MASNGLVSHPVDRQQPRPSAGAPFQWAGKLLKEAANRWFPTAPANRARPPR